MDGEIPETLPNGQREGAERGAEGEDEQAGQPISAGVGGAPSNGRCEGRCGGVSRCVWVRAPRGRERRRRGKFGFGFFFPPPGGVFLAAPAERGGVRFSQLLRLLLPGVRVSRAGGAAPSTEKNGGSAHRGGASAGFVFALNVARTDPCGLWQPLETVKGSILHFCRALHRSCSHAN